MACPTATRRMAYGTAKVPPLEAADRTTTVAAGALPSSVRGDAGNETRSPDPGQGSLSPERTRRARTRPFTPLAADGRASRILSPTTQLQSPRQAYCLSSSHVCESQHCAHATIFDAEGHVQLLAETILHATALSHAIAHALLPSAETVGPIGAASSEGDVAAESPPPPASADDVPPSDLAERASRPPSCGDPASSYAEASFA